MSDSFEATLKQASRFTTYSLALTALIKAVKMLQRRGADPKAISFILSGVDLLVKQLEEAAQQLQNKELVENVLKELRDNQEDAA